jgi:hypothetical protein
MYRRLHVKYSIFLSDFNENEIMFVILCAVYCFECVYVLFCVFCVL